jgi:hypothetical protein
MAVTQEIKKRKKMRVKDGAKKIKVKKKVIPSDIDQKIKPTEDVNPVSKYKEWKLLYRPYPFTNKSNNILKGTDSSISPVAEGKNSWKHKDLCRSCKKRETCILPKPEGGVWRCQEYE